LIAFQELRINDATANFRGGELPNIIRDFNEILDLQQKINDQTVRLANNRTSQDKIEQRGQDQQSKFCL
jgi:hypothetical protein